MQSNRPRPHWNLSRISPASAPCGIDAFDLDALAAGAGDDQARDFIALFDALDGGAGGRTGRMRVVVGGLGDKTRACGAGVLQRFGGGVRTS